MIADMGQELQGAKERVALLWQEYCKALGVVSFIEYRLKQELEEKKAADAAAAEPPKQEPPPNP